MKGTNNKLYNSMNFDKCIHPRDPRGRTLHHTLPTIKKSHASFQSIPKPTSYNYSNVFNIGLVLPLPEHHVNGIIQYILFYIKPLSFSIMVLTYIHVVECINSSFLLLNSIPFTNIIQLSHSPVAVHTPELFPVWGCYE